MHVPVEEGENCFVPDHRMLGLEHPVILVREEQEFVRCRAVGRRMVFGELRAEPKALTYRHTVVVIAVDHEHRRYDLPRTVVR